MTERPRAHQLEDQSRLALGRALPPEWIAEHVVRDYGLDLRVEIFRDGRPSGLFFFVQLKATDRVPTQSGISVRIQPKHLSYWNRLPVPTMVVLWVASSDTLYWQWAHRHHPGPRKGAPKAESMRFSPSMQMRYADPDVIAAEVAYCAKARGGGLDLPVEVYVEQHPLRPSDASAVQEAAVIWSECVDPRVARIGALPAVEQARLVLAKRGFEVRLGRGTMSFGQLDDIHPLTLRQTVSEAACSLGLQLCVGGNVPPGVALLAAHGPSSVLLATLGARAGETAGSPLPDPVVVVAKTGRFDLGLDLAEAWLADDRDSFAAAARRMLMALKMCEARLDEGEGSRLGELLRRDPPLSGLLAEKAGQRIAETLADSGLAARAVEQYAFLTGGSKNAAEMEDGDLERLARLHESLGEHDQAGECLAELIQRHPSVGKWRLDFGVCAALGGRYGEAVAIFGSIEDEELFGETWCWMVTASLAARATASTQARQPAAAREISLRLDQRDEVDPFALFREAAERDAVSTDTWRLYFGALGSKVKPPFGALGIVPLAVLSWADPEWWALALSELTRRGAPEAILRTCECGLRAIGSDFPSLIEKGFEISGFADPSLAAFVSKIEALKSEGVVLRAREGDAGRDGLPVLIVEQAPPGYRLLDLDLRP